MKTNQSIYPTLLLLLMAFFAQAQQSTSTLTPGYWTFGINGGWAYQSSDVKARLNGYGLGLTLGKNLYYRPGAPLAFDLRGRFLFTQQYGLDALRSYNIENNTTVNGAGSLNYLNYPNELQEPRGFIFANHQTTTGELALEGLLTFNQLRERTGVHLGLYGGIGLNWYKAKTDQANFSGDEYFEEYAGLKDNQPTSSIRNELKTILDGDYETIADGNNSSGSVKFMPSLGFELGYQVTPRFLVYGGHRTTFSGTDVLDGQRFENTNNDLYHYTNFGLRWTIDPQKNDPIARKPEIDIIAPFGSPYTTNSAVVSVIADIRNVNSAADVECLVNGRSVPFDYKNGRFALNTNLSVGNNDVIIIARNEAGQARKNLIIVYQNEIINQPVVRAPVIRITNPATDNFRTEESDFVIRATIDNVRNAQEVVFTVNDVDRNFEWENGNFRATIALREGENEIEVRARNSAGVDAEEVTIFYQKPQVSKALPVVTIIEPARNASTKQTTITVEARIQNVSSKSDLTVYFNNTRQGNFSYDTRTGKLTQTIFLERGDNEYSIIAVNRDGEDRASTVIRRMDEIVLKRPPLVRISEPANNSEATTAYTEVRARVEYISNKNDINFAVNGRPIYDFTYNTSSQQLTARVNLEEGNNTIRIRATNADGSDEQTVNVRYRRIMNLPRITINAPVNNSEVQNAYTDLRARVDNVRSRNDINVRLNNVAFYDFEYNISTRQLSAKVGLYEGNNTIEINARNADGTDAATVNVRYRKQALPTVQITSPTNNGELTEPTIQIRARVENVEDKRQIRLTVNGSLTSNFTFDRNRREVTATTTLIEGNNTIRLEASNDAGKAEDVVNVRYRRAQPPTVVILEPTNNLVSNSETTTLRARIETWNRRYTIKVLVNGNVVSTYDFKGNELAAKIPLREGSNTITVQATNTDGKDEASVTVRYERTKNPPTVTFTTPQNGAKLKNNKATVQAKITNMSSARGIIFRVNDKVVQEFDFKDENFTAIVNLDAGNNVLTLSAQNADGNATASIQVETAELVASKPTSLAPSVNFTQPSEAGTVITEKTFKIVANIRNVKSAEEVTLWLNGAQQTDFVFNTRTRQVTAQLDLKEGKNTMRIVVQNDAGKAEDETNVLFQPANGQVKPVITIVSISQAVSDPFKANKGGTTLIAKIEHVAEKNQLKILLNNQEISDFSFDSMSKNIEANLSLKRGENILLIQATNTAGTSELTRKIDY